MLIPTGPMAVDELANWIASIVSAADGIAVWSFFWTYRRSEVLVVV